MTETLNYIKTSIHQIYQCVFKPITFSESIENFDKKSKIKLLFRLSFFSLIISVLINVFVGGVVTYFGFYFDWIGSIKVIAGGIALGIAGGIALGIAGGIALGITLGIAGGIAGGIAVGIAGGIAFGIAFGIAYGIAYGIAGGITVGIAFGIAIGIAFGIVFGIAYGIAYGITVGITVGIAGGITVGIAFIFSYFRIFYIFPHFIQFFRAKMFSQNPFSIFRNSPVYWDEVINLPLPFLSNFLVTLANENREEGLKDIQFISSRRPTQRKAASSALLELTIQDLGRFNSIQEIAKVSDNISSLSSFESSLSKEFTGSIRNIEEISVDVKSYLDSTSNYNKLTNLNVLINDIDNFKKSMIGTKGSVGYKFSNVAEKWSQIIKDENNRLNELRKNTFEEINNPYIFGNPVRPNEKSRLFVGRQDIIREIESNLSNISQKPTLFLYGRRRVGKSSILVNLPRVLGKQYVSVYVDCQDGRFRESLTSFFFNLSKSIFSVLEKRRVIEFASDVSYNVNLSFRNPSLDEFKKDPFTIFGNWLDTIENEIEIKNKFILITFDEYEKLEESIISGALPIEILDQLRNIIQHMKHFVVLISGSWELSELKLNWSDYLISAKTIKLGYLGDDEAKKLIINPIDDFTLNYDGGENGEAVNRIIEVTNGQPYLTQAICHELVNYLNTEQRKTAQLNDIEVAIDKALISANTYFYYIWTTECSETEKELLKRLVDNKPLNGNESAINSLIKKEIIEEMNGNYKFKIELMKKWIEKNS